MKAINHGALMLIEPETLTEYDWLVTRVDTAPEMWFAGALATDFRYAPAILNGFQEEGGRIVLETGRPTFCSVDDLMEHMGDYQGETLEDLLVDGL
jgi:hypothetical protein